jgi:Protein of unknown function (DUF3710)
VKLSRRRGNDDERLVGEDSKGGRHTRSRDRSSDVDRPDATVDTEAAPARGFGPYDVSEAPKSKELFDLGALRIPAVAGVEVHLQTGPEGQIQQIQLAHGGSRLQVAAFAAPRTEGIWEEIRETLRTTLTAGGAKPQEVEGDYGVELTARMTEGTNSVDVRHVGIDGPRWFVHGIYIGTAAVDPSRAGPLQEVLRGLVVDRGIEARPVSEALPLRLPAEAAAQLAAAAEERSLDQAT